LHSVSLASYFPAAHFVHVVAALAASTIDPGPQTSQPSWGLPKYPPAHWHDASASASQAVPTSWPSPPQALHAAQAASPVAAENVAPALHAWQAPLANPYPGRHCVAAQSSTSALLPAVDVIVAASSPAPAAPFAFAHAVHASSASPLPK